MYKTGQKPVFFRIRRVGFGSPEEAMSVVETAFEECLSLDTQGEQNAC